ncbi:MAG: ATP-binding cassette domain-containing protein [Halobacteriaceae archaeon]
MAAIDVQGVTKRFGDVTALQGLDLTVQEGEIYGFLGPNGAGKSTTIDILLDFVRASEGTAEVLGLDTREHSQEIRRRIGVLPDAFHVYERLTGRQHVEFAIESKGVQDDPMALLERVGIPEAADRKAGNYSKGMAQRLVLAMTLVGDPDLLILDEPSTGLDPNGAREMREIIRNEHERGATVFFSSHILEQVEAVCDRVGILRAGELVAEDSIEGLRQAAGGGTTLEVRVDEVSDDVLAAVEGLEGVSNVRSEGHMLLMSTEGGSKTSVLDAIETAGAEVQDFSTQESSLEDLFAHYTRGEGAQR